MISVTPPPKNDKISSAFSYNFTSALTADIEAANNSSKNNISNNTIVSPTSKPSQPSNEDNIHAIIKEMYRNSHAHHTADQTTKKQLSDRNLYLGTQLARYGVYTHRDNNGAWYMDGSNQLLYDKYKNYIYHKGGIAGDNPTLKQNEVMAILEKGEPVLDKKKEEGLYRIIDFTTVLSEKFGKAIASMDMSTLFGNMRSIEDKVSGSLNNVSENQGASVRFGDVYIYGANEETAERHREINRQFTNEVLKQLNIKR